MGQPLYFDDLSIGQRWKSRARTVTETDVVNFAGMSGDYDPLHVDHEFAKQTPFGRPIAHGLLGLALVAGLGSNHPLVHTIAFVGIRSWEFLKPVFIGDTLSAVNEIAELHPNHRRRGTVIWKRQLLNQKGDVIQQGYFETLVARATAKSTRHDAAATEKDRPKPHTSARKSTRKKKA